MRIRCALIAAVVCLTAIRPAAAQPTYNDVLVGNVPTSSGGTLALRMDIFKPANATAATPVVAWIYGGGWTQGSYNAPIHPFVADMLSQGVAVANVSYRLSYENVFPAQIQDVKACIRHLRANAASFGIDGRRIATWGPSAGGHLAALLATSGGVSELEGSTGSAVGTSSRVVAGVDFFGPTDLLNMNLDVTSPPGSGIDHDAPTSPESRLIGYAGTGQGIGVLRANQTNAAAPFPELMQRVTRANSITHVDANDPVMFVAHGTADSSVPLKQSTKLHNALAAAGVPHTYLEVARAGHGDLGETTSAAARAFLLAELTRPFGDADRNNAVDFQDLLVLAQNFGGANRSWRQGDFDTDGMVGFDDLLLLAQNYPASRSFEADWQAARGAMPEQAAVPEPAAIAAFASGSILAGLRARRSVPRN